MRLTDREKEFIARRAGGEYAIIPTVRNIVDKHQKNRDPDDQVFLDFARLVLKQNIPWKEYEKLARAVLAIIPEPFGPPWDKRAPDKPISLPPSETDVEVAPKKRKRRAVKCGICGSEGHNARTCPSKPSTPTVKHTDGIERLSPGFDPNPPKKESSEG